VCRFGARVEVNSERRYFLINLTRVIKQCVVRAAASDKEVTACVGCKTLACGAVIKLSVVADAESGFSAPLGTHGAGLDPLAVLGTVADKAGHDEPDGD